MIIGNPFMFAILVERVAEWNNREAEDNGHFAFCIKGTIAFSIATPEHIPSASL